MLLVRTAPTPRPCLTASTPPRTPLPSLPVAKVTGYSRDLFVTEESLSHNLSHQAGMSSTNLALTFPPSPVSHGKSSLPTSG